MHHSRMIPIVSVVGDSDSGKTTLVAALVTELRGRGYRIATIKHHAHAGSGDVEGKDSWRMSQAGAEVSILSSPRSVMMVKSVDSEMLPADLSHLADGVDLILTEGYRGLDYPKIELLRGANEPSSKPTELIGLVSDDGAGPGRGGIAEFRRDEVAAVADLLVSTFLSAPQPR